MRIVEVFLIFLRLGCVSFGGPIAHIGLLRDEFVKRRQWLAEERYAEIFSICQLLPGPSSSQVCMSIGLLRRGLAGSVAAWLGFTLPSFLLMVLCALTLRNVWLQVPTSFLHGLKVATVAVVGLAVWEMFRLLCRQSSMIGLAFASAAVALISSSPQMQLLQLLCAGILGNYFCFSSSDSEAEAETFIGGSTLLSKSFLFLFFLLLVLLPLSVQLLPLHTLALADVCYRVGAAVFGGGHVVLPLLQAEVLSRHWLSVDEFLAGYGLAQAMPGPLFSFAGFIGALSSSNVWLGAVTATVGIFLPSWLLVVGVLPLWRSISHWAALRRGVRGMSAAVVGILFAAFCYPVCSTAIHSSGDFCIAVCCALALAVLRLPSWFVVLGAAALVSWWS